MNLLRLHSMSILFLLLIAFQVIPFSFFWPMLVRVLLSALVLPDIYFKLDRWYWGSVLFFGTLFHFLF